MSLWGLAGALGWDGPLGGGGFLGWGGASSSGGGDAAQSTPAATDTGSKEEAKADNAGASEASGDVQEITWMFWDDLDTSGGQYG